eukprot:254638-Rhodomonas_salina.1
MCSITLTNTTHPTPASRPSSRAALARRRAQWRGLPRGARTALGGAAADRRRTTSCSAARCTSHPP